MKYEALSATVKPNGWSRWVHVGRKYRIKCCDCGLVHDIAFYVRRNGKLYIAFKRNNRATAAGRKRKKS